MTNISHYKNIPQAEIDALRKTSEGKKYTLNHPDKLLVDMRFKGDGKLNTNSQGWERNSNYYFKSLLNKYPEWFSKKNTLLINEKKAPVVDATFISHFPQYKEYAGETLVHHHIGQDGQAVALPQSIHKGYGEIHSVEHDLGITSNAEQFSNYCKEVCKQNTSFYGQTAEQFRNTKQGIKSNSHYNEKSERKSSVDINNAISRATHTVKDVSDVHSVLKTKEMPSGKDSATGYSNAFSSSHSNFGNNLQSSNNAFRSSSATLNRSKNSTERTISGEHEKSSSR